MKKEWIFLLAVGACLSSCNSDEETSSASEARNMPHAIELSAQACGYTSASALPWSEGASIGVYALKAGTATLMAPYSNVRYHAGTPLFAANNEAETIQLPATGEAWDVAAYFPYTSEATAEGEVPVSVADQQKLATDNVLYARVGSVNNVGYKALLPMRPVLPQLVFSIQITGNYSTSDAQAVSVTLKGFPTSGFLNVADGSLRVPSQTSTANIVLPTLKGEPEREYGSLAKAIVNLKGVVMPVQLTGGCQADVHLPGIGDFTVELSRYQMTFESGYSYLFTLKYVDGSLQVKVTASAIAGWENGGSVSGEGREETK